MDRTLDEQKEAVLSNPDVKSPEGTEGESSGEEISQTETENLENKILVQTGMATTGFIRICVRKQESYR